MNKPKTGMYLWFYAVLAFVLAIFGQTLLCGLLLAFVILTERDSWLICQVIQALGLCFVNSVMGVVSSIFDLVTDYTLAGVSRFFNTTFNVLDQVIAIVVLIFALVAISKVRKGEDANVPLLSGWAKSACIWTENKL